MSATATMPTAVAGGDVSWEPPIRGAFGSSFRFGEWITGPVTPLFEDWAMTRLEAAMHAVHRAVLGQPAPLPHHVVINGWYYYSLAWLPVSPRALLRWAPRLIHRLLTQPRHVAPVIPPTAHLGIPIFEREWREEVLPAYLASVAEASNVVDDLEPAGLLRLVDDLLDRAGHYFAYITAVAGGAYKAEIQLGRFYHQHLAPVIGGSHLLLLVGLSAPRDVEGHAVETLDWVTATAGERNGARPAPSTPLDVALAARRAAWEEVARAALDGSGRRARRFERLLAEAQRLGPVREEQASHFTRPWPVLRRALRRLGEEAVRQGAVDQPDDVFYLYRDELEATIAGSVASSSAEVVAGRREAVRRAAELTPPAFTGDVPRLFERINRGMLDQLGAEADPDGLSGIPVSPGIAGGNVRVVLDAGGFEAFRPGEVLVAPTTAPAWTPLFTRAAAVVTDGGNLFSHTSIAAREFGIPAVVGCADATRRLRDGQHVTVDGARGSVTVTEPGDVSG